MRRPKKLSANQLDLIKARVLNRKQLIWIFGKEIIKKIDSVTTYLTHENRTIFVLSAIYCHTVDKKKYKIKADYEYEYE